MTIAVLVEGREVEPTRLWYPHMSLSSGRPIVPSASYALVIPRASFVAVLAGPYDSAVAELKRDDKVTGKTDFFGEAGYPSLETLLEQPELLTEVVNAYFRSDLFDHFLPHVNTGAGSFILDTITEVRAAPDKISIEGTCLCL